MDAVTGGLMASGDGPCASRPTGGRRELGPPEANKPLLVNAAESVGDDAAAGGLIADAAGLIGGPPELNSAHRGHLRFVSVRRTMREQPASAATRR